MSSRSIDLLGIFNIFLMKLIIEHRSVEYQEYKDVWKKTYKNA